MLFVSGATNEDLLYMTNYSTDGGLIESIPLRDSAGNLHTFLHLRTLDGEKLVHLYYVDGEQNISVIEESARGVQIRCTYQIGIVYSKITEGGEMIFYFYTWNVLRAMQDEVVRIPRLEVFNNIFNFRVFYAQGKIHIFHDYLYGLFGMMMNITHYSGVPITFYGNEFERESFFIPSSSWKQILDFTIDGNDNIWYLFRFTPLGYEFGVGIAQLANGSIFFKTNRTFSNVLYPVENFKAQPATGVENTSFVFATPQTFFWGSFNGSRITENSQTIFYSNPVDLSYISENNEQTVLISDLVEDSTNVNLYVGTFEENHWVFSGIQSEYPISQGYFSNYLKNSDFILIYNSTVEPSKHSKIGVSYREKQANAVFIITSYSFPVSGYVEGLSTYSPFVEFFRTKWYIPVSVFGALLALIALSIIIWKTRGESIKKFLGDKRVGEYKAFVLVFVNIGRFFSNAFSTVFTIWFSNKRRSLLTLTGFIITGYLLSSAIIIAQSEESTMIKAYERAFSLSDDGIVSAQVTTTFISPPGDSLNISSDYASLAKQEIVDLFDGTILGNYITGIESCYIVSASVLSQFNTTYNFRHITALPDDSDPFIETILSEGRVPQSAGEVCISKSIGNTLNIELNGKITVIASNTISGVPPSDLYISLKVVGFFISPERTKTHRITNTLGLPDDIYSIFKSSHLLTKQSYFFDIFNNATRVDLQQVYGYFQLNTDFREFSIDERTVIVNELIEKYEDKVFSFSFDDSAAVHIGNEMESFFSSFNTYYLNNMARLLIFSIPAIILSIYMVFESSELFSSSYEKEIEILRGRGLSNRRITTIYLSTRLIEIVIASVASFGFAALTATPLLKINGFISFNNPDAELVLGNIPFAMFIVGLVLFIISIPRIIIIVSRKRKIEKVPSKLKKILSFISWRDMFFLMLGLGLLIYFYNEAFVAYYESNIGNFTTYLLLTIAGAIFTLLGGLPLVIKLLSVLWKGIGILVWKSRKRKINFLFAEISKDIRYFENITLIFLLIVSILLPVLVVPYSKETTLTEQAYFINGSDLRIKSWHNVNGITLEEIEAMPEVQSITNIRVYNMIFIVSFGLSFGSIPVRVVVMNQTDFLETISSPSNEVTDFAWSKIKSLNANNVLMSKPMLDEFRLDVGETMDIQNSSQVPTIHHYIEIEDGFDLFPVYYLMEDLEDEDNTMVMTVENYEEMIKVNQYAFKTEDDLFIKLRNPTAASIDRVKQAIFEKTGTQLSDSFTDVKDKLKTPLYNIFIIEMLLSLFVSVAVLIFSSFTTAIKILEKRVIKHDIMKKMGINVRTIINMSSLQTMIAAILPTLILGSIVGFSVMYPTILQLSYGATPYPVTVRYPIVLLIVLFVLIPALVYLCINYFLRREFTKYAPTMME